MARDFYKRPNLKRENVKPTRLVDFENIAKQFKVNIRLFEPRENQDKTAWRLVFGKNQFKKNLPCVDIGLFVYEDHDEKQAEKDNRYLRQGHCFFIKDIELLTKTWECVGCRQRFNRHDNYNRHVTGGTCGGGKTKLICPGEKFERIMNSTEKVFYGGNTKFSYAACQWIEKQSELIGRHIHHALCGHGGEYYVYLYAGKEKDSRAREIPVDGYEPESNTIFQYRGCKWHGCPCQKRKERNSPEEALIAEQRYAKTIELEKKMKEQGFKIVSVWECEKPEMKKKRFCKKFRPYPYFIVYDFEAICQKINEKQTDELTITAKHIPVSVAINDNLTKKPSFIVEEDPKKLNKKFVVELLKRASEIEETVWLSNPVLGVYKKFNEDDKGEQYGGYLINEARVKLSKETAKGYVNWVKQVPVFGFNSGRYDINMIKEYFVENLTSLSDVNVAKKENSYMFLSTPKQLGDTAKLKGNSFYGKMIENLEKHISTKFTTDEKLIDKIFRSPFFDNLEEINKGVFEVRQRKRQVTITRPYQCGIAVYQLAKLRMLEFYYDFLDKFCDRRDFELIQMDTDSFYMALSANDFDEIIKPEMKELYKEEKKNWLVTDEYSKRVPGLFKPEFRGKRMIALTSKCYYADSGRDEGIKKFSCKGVSRRQNEMNWERYRKALFGSLDKARNIGFRKRDNHIVTYEQSKLGLSAYYDKRIVHEDGIHTSCL